MRRSTAAVLATAAAVAVTGGKPLSAAVHTAVRAEVVVAGEGHPLGIRRIRIVDPLRPGESYSLPALSIRNHRGVRTAFQLVAFGGAPQAGRPTPRRWLRFVPAVVVIDPGRTRAVGVRLTVPRDAAPASYAVVLGARPDGLGGAPLTFRIEPVESTRASHRQAANLAMWMVPALAGAVLAVFVVRGQQTGSKRLKPLRSTMRVRGGR